MHHRNDQRLYPEIVTHSPGWAIWDYGGRRVVCWIVGASRTKGPRYYEARALRHCNGRALAQIMTAIKLHLDIAQVVARLEIDGAVMLQTRTQIESHRLTSFSDWMAGKRNC